MLKKYKNIIIGFLVALIIGFLIFKGNAYKNSYKTLLDDLQEQSDKKIDSLFLIIKNSDKKILELNQSISEKRAQNNYLQSKLNQREKDLYIRDTVFISNANRSAKYINRYYKKNDSIR